MRHVSLSAETLILNTTSWTKLATAEKAEDASDQTSTDSEAASHSHVFNCTNQ